MHDTYNRKQAWTVAFAATFFMFVGCSSLNMLTPVLSLILEELGQDTNYGSLLNLVDTGTSAILAIPVGLAVNKWGYRKIGILAYIVITVSFAWGAMPVSSDYYQLLMIRCLQGVGYAVPPILSIAVVAQYFPKNRQAIPIVIVGCMTDAAKVVMLQISKITIPLGGWHGQFAGALILCLIGFAVFVALMKDPPPEGSRALTHGRPEKQEKAPLSVALKDWRVWMLIVIMCAFTLGRRGFDPFSNMIWVDNCGIDNNHASDIDSLFFFMNIPSGLLFGYILQHFTRRRGAISACLLTVYFIGMGLVFFLNEAWMGWTFAVVVGLVGSAPSFCQAALPIIIRNPAILTMALSLFDTVGKYIFGSIAPFLISSIQSAMDSWIYCSIPFIIVGLIAIAATWCVGLELDRKSACDVSSKHAHKEAAEVGDL